MLVGSLILAACGTDSGSDVPENRQFANDPAPTRIATDTPEQQPTVAETVEEPRVVVATPADLLRTRGAPSTLYTVTDDDLTILEPTTGGVGVRHVDLPDDAEVLGIAASPTGDRAGVLLSTEGAASPFVQFFNRDGELIGGPFGVQAGATPVASPGATPLATPGAISAIPPDEQSAASGITWVPQGNGVIVVTANGVFSVDIEGDVEPVPADRIPGSIVHAEASPMGGQVLIQAVQDDGTHIVYIVQSGTGQVYELYALRTMPGRGLSQVHWLPTGTGVVYVEGELIDGEVMRGQLYAYQFRNEAPSLVATSGQGGPSATITHVSVSPDGSVVAYDVSIRDGVGWALHSLWVSSLRANGAEIEIPAPTGDMVLGLEWSRQGLVWFSESRFTAGDRSVYLMMPAGEVLDVTPRDPDLATPGASPIASPGATPVGSLDATPGASPPAPGP